MKKDVEIWSFDRVKHKKSGQKEKGPGRRATKSLFVQFPNNCPGLEEQPYDLDEFRRVYLEQKDFNGYSAAQILLTMVPPQDRWAEWKRIFHSVTIVRRYFEEWQAELKDLLRAEATQIIAKGGSAADIQRARLILSGELFGERKGAGRPTKGSKRGARQDPSDIPATENLDRIIQLKKKEQ